ncbi:hypothetical protein ASD39_06000 [Sphingomonas sp. Root50]|nr:hypothetical protein ASD17_03480 [Sphingomonas sp. Root1294]KQY68432.1 hypothetical protein ASD39_06000 [Sphingomonas sp. Root50]KRB91391.1 hypothetical protein ASE22_12800 [Sphingomonas sp. Root720]
MLAGDPDGAINACFELCDRWCGQGRTALRWVSKDGGAVEIGYDELRARSSRFASLLIDLGVGHGDRIAGLLPRTPELLVVLLGTLRIGAVYQPLFTAFGPGAIATRLDGSGARVVITDRCNRPKLDGMDVRIFVTDEPTGAESLSAALDGRAGNVEPVPLSAGDHFLMLFTSGTTGSAKGVAVPIHMLRAIWAYMRFGIGLRDEDSYWNLADPGWAYGLYYAVCGPLLLGQAATMSEAGFSVETAYDLIARFGITNLAGAPTAFRAMAASDLAPPRALRAISSAGEPLDPETGAWLARAFGCRAGDHYGQTELGMVLCDHNGLDHPRDRGGLGYPMPGFAVTTIREDGSACDAGEPGTLAVRRSSPLFWFTGYPGREEQPFLGDHYLTGDSAVRLADGSFRFVGRDDDVITSSGYRIGPFEVESALMEHPAVIEAAVIGKPDPVRTELVKAFVRLTPGAEASPALADEIGLFVKTRLAAHAYPREIAFVDELPKTPSGKVQRFKLRTGKFLNNPVEDTPSRRA